MNCQIPCVLVLLGCLAVLVPSIGCGGGGGGETPGAGGDGTGAPVLLDLPVLWRDLNGNSLVDEADQLILRFDRPVANGGGDPSLELDVLGPGSIEAGSTWTDGPAPTELTVNLGVGSLLTPGLLGAPSRLVLSVNTIVNPGDPGAGSAVGSAGELSIMVHVTASGQNAGSGSSLAVLAFDSDGDGPTEFVVGKNGPNEVFQSSAAGIYQAPVIPTGDPGLDTRGLAAADLNGDMFADLVTANFNGPNYVYLNDGAGNFTHTAIGPPTPNQLGAGASRAVALAQWDAALGLDVFVANNGVNYIYFGDGGGLFDGPAPGVLPGVQDRLTFPGGAADTRAAVAFNWDGAALIDIITVDDPGGGLPAVITLHVINPGPIGAPPVIVSAPLPPGALPAPRSAEVLFWDGDALPDLLVGYANGGGMQLWRQGPIGAWTLVGTFPGGDVHALAVLDLNLDGFDDVVQGRANGQPDQVLLNAIFTTTFLDAGLQLGNGSTFAFDVLDGDGMFGQDFLSSSVTPNVLWLTAR